VSRSEAEAIRWIDSHCHLTADEFGADRAEVIARARDGGVAAFVAIGAGYGVAHNALAIEVASREPDVFAAVGIHPHDASLLDDAGRKQLGEWLGAPRVVAVGECGLDYHYLRSPREVQREVLAEQLAWARERSLPVSIHVRGDEPNAFAELLDLWRVLGRGEIEGVLHCYTGDLDFARRAIRADLLVSFSGILTFKRDRGLRAVAAALPLERLLVETDAPLLAPEGYRGKRNEPLRVAQVGEALAVVQGRPLAEVARITAQNARRLFRLPEDCA
jgi:TatD DNase family protein